MKKYRKRARFTAVEKAKMWDRWQRGDSLHRIARLLDTSHTSVRRNLAMTGGIRPSQRTRSRLALSLAEREEISRGLATGHSLRSIATTLGRAPSTISREIRRNGGAVVIEPTGPSRPPGTARDAPSPVNWRSSQFWRAWW